MSRRMRKQEYLSVRKKISTFSVFLIRRHYLKKRRGRGKKSAKIISRMIVLTLGIQRNGKIFLQSPTECFQSLPLIDRGEKARNELPKGTAIRELIRKPYDVSRVRVFEADGRQFVVKKVDIKKVHYPLEEFDIAKQASAAAIPTSKPVGYVIVGNNLYEFFEYIPHTASLEDVSHIVKERGLSNHSFNYGSFTQLERNLSSDPEWRLAYRKELKMGGDLGALRLAEKALTIYRNAVLRHASITNALKKEGNIEHWKEAMRHTLSLGKSKGAPVVFDTYEVEELAEVLDENFPGDELHDYRADLKIAYSKFKEEQDNKFIPRVEREVLGASYTMPYRAFCTYVDARCEEAGIQHKDFAFRNILVKMDEYKENLLPDRNGDAQFYIIDWEQKS